MINSEMFNQGTMVVYPAHGVGQIVGKETQAIAGMDLTTFVVFFEREKMTLRIPVDRALDSGLRPLCTEKELTKVNKTLKGRPRTSRGMWSRRAKEYESKINSGNIVSLAEVVRDLHKNVDDPDRSYSERIIYENALIRLAGEISAVQQIEIDEAQESLVKVIKENTPKIEVEEISTIAPAPDLDGDDDLNIDEEEHDFIAA